MKNHNLILCLMALFLSAGVASFMSAHAESRAGPASDLLFWNETIRLDPENAEAFFQRGNAHKSLGRYQRAIEDYHHAIRLKPEVAGLPSTCFSTSPLRMDSAILSKASSTALK